MVRRRGSRWVAVLVVTLVVASASPAASMSSARRPLRFSTARILFELNATAQDAGIQMLLDGEGWEHARIIMPDGRTLMDVRARGSVGDVGVTELSFESAEPSLADLSLEDLLRMFP